MDVLSKQEHTCSPRASQAACIYFCTWGGKGYSSSPSFLRERLQRGEGLQTKEATAAGRSPVPSLQRLRAESPNPKVPVNHQCSFWSPKWEPPPTSIQGHHAVEVPRQGQCMFVLETELELEAEKEMPTSMYTHKNTLAYLNWVK